MVVIVALIYILLKRFLLRFDYKFRNLAKLTPSVFPQNPLSVSFSYSKIILNNLCEFNSSYNNLFNNK